MFDPVLIPGRPSTDGITWWALAIVGDKPQIELLDDDPADPADIACHELHHFGDDGRAFLIATTSLQPDTRYRMRIRDDAGRSIGNISRTLPEELTPGVPFTLALGSCYNWPMDLREVFRAFPPASHAMDSADPIRLCFLLGDQIYMDLEKSIDTTRPDAWSQPMADAPDPWESYKQQWTSRRYRDLLRAGNSYLFLADDHEMWNDYPHKPLWLPWTRGERAESLTRHLLNAFDVFQAALNLEPGSVGNASTIPHTKIRREGLSFAFDVPPLSFFVLDTRIGRTRADTTATPVFCNPAHLDAVVDWLGADEGFGVLAIAPPVFQGKGSAFDHNLADYEGDYERLVDAISSSPRPVLILAGDIHYSRLYTLFHSGSTAGPTAAEFVSSALSRLKEPPGTSPPSGEAVVTGELGDSGADFVLETPDPIGGHPQRFVTTERQTFGTVTITLGDGAPTTLQVICRSWKAEPTGAELLLQKTLTWPIVLP